MTAPKKKVAIIGAGACGLPCIKECLEGGLEPVCFERTADIGGLWNFRSAAEDGVACVNLTTVSNIGKEIMVYSDFPMPSHYPNFMHHRLVLDYFYSYAEKFDLRRYIRFNTAVKRLEKARDYDATGRWRVVVENDGQTETLVFDAVMVCTGHHGKPKMAKFAGDDKFKGEVIHTHQYREGPAKYVGKKVVVIGMGDSALDAATEICEVALKVFVSTRRGGQWLYSRMWKDGLPWDVCLLNRFAVQMWTWFPNYNCRKREKELGARFDYDLYGIKPKHRVTHQHPMISDDLPQRLLTGRIEMKPDVREVTSSGVKFVDGSFEDDVDAIIHGTGWVLSFPFLDESITKTEGNWVELYRYVFPPDLKHPTLAIIGCVQPDASTIPIAEMQARWSTRLFKGELKLPSKEEMWTSIREVNEAEDSRFYKTERHTIDMGYAPYMDALAEEVGCSPKIGKYFLTDPVFAYKLIFWPLVPYQYRLRGPGKWDGARCTIETLWDRIAEPLKGSRQDRCRCGGLKTMMTLAMIPVVLFLFYSVLF